MLEFYSFGHNYSPNIKKKIYYAYVTRIGKTTEKKIGRKGQKTTTLNLEIWWNGKKKTTLNLEMVALRLYCIITFIDF